MDIEAYGRAVSGTYPTKNCITGEAFTSDDIFKLSITGVILDMSGIYKEIVDAEYSRKPINREELYEKIADIYYELSMAYMVSLKSAVRLSRALRCSIDDLVGNSTEDKAVTTTREAAISAINAVPLEQCAKILKVVEVLTSD